MSKKSALDLAIEHILRYESNCNHECMKRNSTLRKHKDLFKKYNGNGCLPGDCPLYDEKIKIFKQYFQQQATIPDGWDVVREIRNHLIREAAPGVDCGHTLNETMRLINTRLQQAGIEVE